MLRARARDSLEWNVCGARARVEHLEGLLRVICPFRVLGIVHSSTPFGGSQKSIHLRFCNLRHASGSIGIQNWGFYFLDPPGSLSIAKMPDLKAKQLCGKTLAHLQRPASNPLHEDTVLAGFDAQLSLTLVCLMWSGMFGGSAFWLQQGIGLHPRLD